MDTPCELPWIFSYTVYVCDFIFCACSHYFICLLALLPSLQSEEPVQLPAAPESGKVDLIEYENPADLIKALLEQLGGSASLNKICKVSYVQCAMFMGRF